jgi:hypothetical protein
LEDIPHDAYRRVLETNLLDASKFAVEGWTR